MGTLNTHNKADCADVLRGARRLVIKAGSSLVFDLERRTLRHDWLAALAKDIAGLIEQDARVLVVSSGAVAVGRAHLDLLDSPLTLEKKQAAAAIGQPLLQDAWRAATAKHGLDTAQALLTLDDTENRRRWLNSRTTLDTLTGMHVLPIINENDTVASDEIRYGDNDRLAARVAQMCDADLLVLLSDVDGLWSADPNQHKDARHIEHIDTITPAIMAMAEGPNSAAGIGSGGMVTKLAAAQIATRAGAAVILGSGIAPHPLRAIMDGARASLFSAAPHSEAARKSWIAGTIKPAGQVHIDGGAHKALQNGASLLPVGMVKVNGAFSRGDVVSIITAQGIETGRGIAAYSAEDAARICGLKSAEITARLGYDARAAMIHRDDMVILDEADARTK